MTTVQNTASLIQQAERFIVNNPQKLIGQFEWNDQLVWMKRRPFSKKNHWHKLQGILARLVKRPTFAPTATVGGSDSLRYEAERLRSFSVKNIPVPNVLAVTEHFMLTEDVGLQLQNYLYTLTDAQEIQQRLTQAISTVRDMHQAGLCHGRPSLRDMTIKNGIISLIDLEENPLQVMQLAQAQARDIWLFLNSAARFCDDDVRLLKDLFHAYRTDISPDTLQELKKMVKQLKPFRRLLDTPLKAKLGRDVRCAIKANKALEDCLFPEP